MGKGLIGAVVVEFTARLFGCVSEMSSALGSSWTRSGDRAKQSVGYGLYSWQHLLCRF